MENNITSADELKTIRKIMEGSTRFLSLSGLSGIFAGTFALGGAIIGFLILNSAPVNSWLLLADAGAVLILALASTLYFSLRRAHKAGVSLWTPVLRRLVINMTVPLVTGGLFIILLIYQNNINLIVPGMLIFYGLSLVNAGKFTYGEIFYLGILEIITGLVSVIFPAYGVYFWGLGFGLLHIIYGVALYRKYEA